ncbi:hypothetical protein, variant [Aphanomyces invadans]|uniref:F-box domain-containing protein n=1 Tax=Aphanomyces invadans TaxID=157072 RepID=A0A024U1B4_9STRA|nr:hypothetical protein, variant [Aphanomyces invadans]ETW00039.1 hypothetical protein, variant [Aphanomyces invadans]|eukprot:XP_008871064.1 hypothetical protein, variant [Aphanomyces invadans]
MKAREMVARMTGHAGKLGLPRECIHIVASYLDHLALHAMEMTCRTFFESGIHGAYWRMSALREAVVIPTEHTMDWKTLACSCVNLDAQQTAGLLGNVVAFSSVDRPREEGAKNTLRVSRCFRRMRARSDDGPQQALLNYTLQTLICGCSQGDCYWSSAPSASEIQDDYIDYTLVDRCIIRAIDIVPYKAFWQMGEPGYAPMKVSISFFTPGDSSNADRCMYYTSPSFDVVNRMEMQTFFLPRLVLAQANTHVRVNFHGKQQFEYVDAVDYPRRYFCCISHVGVNGILLPLNAELH